MGEAAKFAHRLLERRTLNAVEHRRYEEPELPVVTLTELRDVRSGSLRSIMSVRQLR
jgi:putative transposase